VSSTATTGLTLDAGALLALDHPAKAVAMQARLEAARRRGGTICAPAEAVAQAWRSPRQARLARLLKSPDLDIAIMTLGMARAVGLMCAASGHDDVVDVHVVLCARQRNHAIVTSDPRDIARIDATVPRILV
jgi:DNA-binding NarL/FixJ family response regulator